MNAASTTAPSGGIFTWPRRAEAWLDDKGKGAWIAAMVLGFIFFWPVGLALLAYMIWSKRMFSRPSCAERRAHHMARHCGSYAAMRPSGNTAFDAYKAETIRRLQEEQEAFEGFLQRLREAKDKSEFDNFMEDRARAARDTTVTPTASDSARPGEY
jgi:hypothetical protein